MRACSTALIFALGLPACGAANVAAYQGTAAACIAGEEIVIAREGTTEAEDNRDLGIVRTLCDAILAVLREVAP